MRMRSRRRTTSLDTIYLGGAAARYRIADDGMVDASLSGLLTPKNAGLLSGLLLAAGVERRAVDVLSSVEQALVALPPIAPAHYAYVPPDMHNVPVAVIVSPEQYGVYARITQAAAVKGTIRRAFLSRDEAEAWVREQCRALRANRNWWSGQRPSLS